MLIVLLVREIIITNRQTLRHFDIVLETHYKLCLSYTEIDCLLTTAGEGLSPSLPEESSERSEW